MRICWLLYTLFICVPNTSAIPSRPLRERSATSLSRHVPWTVNFGALMVHESGKSITKRNKLSRHSQSIILRLGLGWTVTYTLLHICVSLTPLSKPEMVYFYSSVLDLARNLWIEGFNERVWEVSMNDVVLKFSSSGPITWFWMQEFLLTSVSSSLRQ